MESSEDMLDDAEQSSTEVNDLAHRIHRSLSANENKPSLQTMQSSRTLTTNEKEFFKGAQ